MLYRVGHIDNRRRNAGGTRQKTVLNGVHGDLLTFDHHDIKGVVDTLNEPER